MNTDNMLPPRGHSPERIESDAATLRAIVETEGADAGRKRKLRRIGVPLVIAAGLAGIGGAAAAAILNLGHVEHGRYGKDYPVSSDLRMSISVDHGPIGTPVRIDVTGCYDPNGHLHYLSFLPDATDLNGATQREQDIPVTLANGSFTATFQIPSDATAHAQFRVGCGGSSQQAPFETTNPVTARACSAADVTATLAKDGGAAAGHLILPLTFKNVSATACWLRGAPEQVRLAEFNGKFFAATPDGFGDGPYSLPMAPGGTTTMSLDITNACTARPGGGPAVTRHGVLQVLIGGRWVTATGGQTEWDTGCGIGFGSYSTP